MTRSDRSIVAAALLLAALLLGLPTTPALAQVGGEPRNVVGEQIDRAVDLINEWEQETGTSALPLIDPPVPFDLDRQRVVVVDQRNGPGIDVSWRVTLTPGVVMPDLRGLTVGDARATLAPLALAVATEPRSAPPDSRVVDHAPDPGSLVRLGTTAVLLVAQTTTVPPVRGLSEPAAVDRLEEAGLRVGEIRPQDHGRVPEGEAIGTEPPEGTEVEVDSEVLLIISTGPPLVEVPDVVGRRRAAAQRLIEDAGLTNGPRSVEDSDAPRNEVLRQEPVAGSVVPRGSAVELTLSSGPSPTVRIPQVRGLTEGAATEEIIRAELVVAETRSEASEELERDLAIGTEPVGGTLVPVGSGVDLIISTGGESDAGIPPILVGIVILALLVAVTVGLRYVRSERTDQRERERHRPPLVEARAHPDTSPRIRARERRR